MEASTPQEQPADDGVLVGSTLGYDPSKPIMTAGDLLDSGLVGIWKDREDISDNLDFARKLGRHPRSYE